MLGAGVDDGTIGFPSQSGAIDASDMDAIKKPFRDVMDKFTSDVLARAQTLPGSVQRIA